MKRIVSAGVIFLALSAGASSRAQEASLRTAFQAGTRDNPAELAVFPQECSAAGCIPLRLTCRYYDPAIILYNLDKTVLAAWLLLNNGAAFINTGSASLNLEPEAIQLDETGLWRMRLLPDSEGADFLLAANSGFTVHSPVLNITLPSGPADRQNIMAFASACAGRPMPTLVPPPGLPPLPFGPPPAPPAR